MGHVIRSLLALQEVDLQVISLNDQKTELLDSVNQEKSGLENQRRLLEEREAQLKRLKVDIKKLEVELVETTDRIRKLEGQQIHVKTNQEYKALDKEIYEAKAHQLHIEDVLLQKMELLEDEKGEVPKAAAQLSVLIAEFERRSAVIEEKIREINRVIEQLQAKRCEVSSGIEGNLLKLYDRIFRSKSGPALVPIVNRACQGCHLAVPAGVESVLRRREADIITCENCSRILYVPDEEAD